MIKWSRRLLLLGILSVAVSTVASACTDATLPRLPELEQEPDTVTPEDG